MFWWKAAVAALLFCGTSSAAPGIEQNIRTQFDRRDTTNSTSNATSALLEPVIPSDVNLGDITNLALDKQVTLAWAGSVSGTQARRLRRRDSTGPLFTPLLKRDGAVSSVANFTFQYPTIPLDQSSYITSVKCTSSSVTGTLSTTAYSYAKARWTNAGKILFVTSVDGCGADDQNHLFLATSVTFVDKTRSFTAKGAPSTYKSTGYHMNLKWGKVAPTAMIKRAADKSEMFEPHRLNRRRTSLGISWDLTFTRFANVDLYAPWDSAVRLANWTKAGGKEDNSYSKGEVKSADGHHKRSNETSLALREPLDERGVTTSYEFGLALYCVECGFTGGAEVWGELDVSFIPFGINTAQAGFDANFAFDMNFGLAAFVVYEKEWEKELAKVELAGFEIPLICDIGTFVELALQAKIGISATGTLLLGGGIHYDNIGFVIDFLDSSNSHSTTLPPRYQHRAEATGELKIEAGVGMPIKLGLGIGVLGDLWEADAAIVDTPSLNIEGVFEVSATVADDGTISTDINGGCYGIAWNVFFQNLIQLELKADGLADEHINLFKPFKSDPLAEGCIGYVADGTKDATEAGGSGSGAGGNGLGGGNGLSGGQAGTNPTNTSSSGSTGAIPSGCKPSQIVDNFTAAVKAGNTCKKITTQAAVSAVNGVGKGIILADVTMCADACFKEPKCLSWSLSDKGAGGRGTCQMYIKKASSLGITTKSANPTLTFYDKACWMYKNCRT